MTDPDDAAIRDPTARFADAITRGDCTQFERLWWDDGVWEITEPYVMVATGMTEVLAMYDRLMDGWAFFAQLVHSGLVEIEGSRARARWIMREVARGATNGRSYDNLAIYDDMLERREGVWRFVKRRYCCMWVSDAAIPGRCFPLPDGLGFGKSMQRS